MPKKIPVIKVIELLLIFKSSSREQVENGEGNFLFLVHGMVELEYFSKHGIGLIQGSSQWTPIIPRYSPQNGQEWHALLLIFVVINAEGKLLCVMYNFVV